MNSEIRKLLGSTWLHICFAFFAMGGWAFYSNAAYPMPTPLWAGVIQGCLSASLTLFLKNSVDWMQPKFSFPIPACIASVSSASLLVGGHVLAGTPEVLMTIAVPLTVSASYIFLYSFLKQRKANEATNE